MKSQKISVILPIKNEPRIGVFLEKLALSLYDLDYEICLQFEEGITNAIWHGVQRAKGDIVVILDSDGAHDAFAIRDMLEAFYSHDVDLALGCRVHSEYPFERRVLGLFCTWLTRRLLGLKLRDPLTAFIVAKRKILRFRPQNGCKFLLDVLSQVPENRIIEHPIIHHYSGRHKSKLKPTEGIYLLRQLWRLWTESRKQSMA